MKLTLFFAVIFTSVSGKRINDVSLKYPDVNTLSERDKTLFLFNNIGPFKSKKLGYFVFEVFKKRKQISRL